MSEKPPTYPPLPPSEPLLSERVADLEAQIRESGDAAAVAELKSKLTLARKDLNTLHEQCDRMREERDEAGRDRDEALKANADACELLSHHVEPPFADLPVMVSTLLEQHRAGVDARRFTDHVFGPFGSGDVWIGIVADAGTYDTCQGSTKAECAEALRLTAKRRASYHDTPILWRTGELKREGFTPPHSPAKVSPATFGPTVHDSIEIASLPAPIASAAVQEIENLLGQAGEILDAKIEHRCKVKQLGGPPLCYATDGSSGLDLPIPATAQLGAGASGRFRTGITLEIPPGYEGQIRPRSSCPKTLEVRFGTIDSDYRGEIQVVILSKRAPHDTGYDTIGPDKAIAQLVIAPVAKVEIERVESKSDLSETSRGAGGFGSTDLATREGWQRWLDETAAKIDTAKAEAEEVQAAFDRPARVTRVHATLETEGALKDVSIPVAVAKHPIQAAAEQVTATTEELLTARAKAAEATRAYQAAVDEQEEKSKGLAVACAAVNEWTAHNRLDFAKAIEIGNKALDGIGLTSYRCAISGDPWRLSLVREPFVGPDLERAEDISDE